MKKLPKGSKIGYGGTYVAKKPFRLGILPIGYADGFPRSLSNRGSALVNGVICPVRGRVCMNVTMVDVTDVPRVKAGDRATIIGKNHNAEITADQVARQAGTISYELVSRINPAIPRILT